ncbi:unnamed protein product [Sphagnum balticum]
MPALSPTMASGTIVKWNKKRRRDQVDELCLRHDVLQSCVSSAGDVLCEVQTDKAVVSLEADEDGTLAKILVNKDSAEVNVGSSIAIIAEAGEDWKSVKVRPLEHARIRMLSPQVPADGETSKLKQPPKPSAVPSASATPAAHHANDMPAQ